MVIGAAAFLAWPLLNEGPVEERQAPPATQLQQAVSALAMKRDNALGGLRDAEMDYATGKLSESDYDLLRHELETEAMNAFRELDLAEKESKAFGMHQTGSCPSCGTGHQAPDAFCGNCGQSLPHGE